MGKMKEDVRNLKVGGLYQIVRTNKIVIAISVSPRIRRSVTRGGAFYRVRLLTSNGAVLKVLCQTVDFSELPHCGIWIADQLPRTNRLSTQLDLARTNRWWGMAGGELRPAGMQAP